MALFAISRYQGEEDEEISDKNQSEEILKRIHKKVKQKQRELKRTNVQDVDDATEKKKRRKSLDIDKAGEDSARNDGDVHKISDDEKNTRKCGVNIPTSKEKRKNNRKILENREDVKSRNEVNSDNCLDDDHDIDNDDADDHQKGDDQGHNIGATESQEQTIDERITDIGGFTVMGDVAKRQTHKVNRVLPRWLSRPTVITQDVNSELTHLDSVQGLDDDLISALKKNGIHHFFPVQHAVIPAVVKGLRLEKAGYRPQDICCSAPTGSGKTLAFVLPIIQALKERVVCRLRAVVILPVRDLASQVFKVFETYCQGTHLNVQLITGQKSFSNEQELLVKSGPDGPHSLVDILVATPGRLVDHLQQTDDLDLTHLRFLVVDEADRTMEIIKQDWLNHIENAVYHKPTSSPNVRQRLPPGPLIASNFSKPFIPLQKLLFSATLSQNPEKLQQLNLFQPELLTSVIKPASNTTNPEVSSLDENSGEFVGKYTTPIGLKEIYIVGGMDERPLLMLHLLHHHGYRHVLCFTNSVETTHRLFWLIKLYGGITVAEFSSLLSGVKRSKMLRKFSEGEIDVLICSDAMARGIDVNNVQYVISYESPPFIKTYIHRIGRTARAGREGTALTMLDNKEVFLFKKMLSEAGKKELTEMKVKPKKLSPLIENYHEVLAKLPEMLQKKKSMKRKT